MKFITKNTPLALFLMAMTSVFAQAPKEKVDGVVGVVGDFVILDSDIDLEYIQLKARGVDTNQITRCELFGKQLEDKLYAHQAIQDSIIVTDAEVNSFMDQQIDAMVEQVGSLDKVIAFYRKKNVDDFRSYFFDIIKNNKLTEQMQKKIIDDVEITPEEVRNFFKEIPQDEIPTFGAEVEVAQIVVKPIVSEEEKQKVVEKLRQIRQEVIDGSSFFSKAVLFSEDPGSSSNGGFYKMNRKTPFVKEFKDVAFSLDEGEISEPFETEFGYHIIMVEKIKGQEVELRHILIAPKYTNEALKEAKEKIELIRSKIMNNEISFSDAAKSSSDEKETRNNGGVLLNPRTLEPRFELTKMDPALYSQISSLKDGEISQPILSDNQQGAGKFYKIITVNNRTEEHKADFAQDYLKIKELALRDKQIKTIGKWTEEKIAETYIKISQDYKQCEFTNNWLKK
ncbi:MAG: peptidylprolyl isomerase [Flavobacterium sp.]|uniref:peptidylprolyl isomerase n=1 Tax=unclassified Flavobacterium TaxID=196869 RepID=UPI000C4F513D|nr:MULTISPECIES: peptidylprolyl isomerase [unclassified Flavobacterium]MBF04508.1 peptidylprolyl isomerase [Flavobacterium sp.]MCO6164098.1 peptidylprolyl isomerase [Flavobacterium sp. NRK F7]